jgi:hypothetical protein
VDIGLRKIRIYDSCYVGAGSADVARIAGNHGGLIRNLESSPRRVRLVVFGFLVISRKAETMSAETQMCWEIELRGTLRLSQSCRLKAGVEWWIIGIAMTMDAYRLHFVV